MDSTTLLWNFDDKMGEQDLEFCHAPVVSDGDISMIFSSMARPVPQSNSVNSSAMVAPGSYGLAPTPPPKEQLMNFNVQETQCPICQQEFSSPKVLACFHSFCKACLCDRQSQDDRVVCPLCSAETLLSPQLGVDGLLSDYGLLNICERRSQNGGNVSADEDSPKGSTGTPTEDKGLIFGSPSSSSSTPTRSGSPSNLGNNNAEGACVICTSGSRVVAACRICGFLCANCRTAHKFMHCFEGHDVEDATVAAREHHSSSESSSSSCNTKSSEHCRCLEHRSQPLRFFCITCNLAICIDCTMNDHVQPSHEVEPIERISDKQIQRMETMVNNAAKKQQQLFDSFRIIDSAQTRLHSSHSHAIDVLNNSCDMIINAVHEMRQLMVKDLEAKFGIRQLNLTHMDKEVQKVAKKMSQMIEFTRRLLNYSTPTEIMVFKPLIDTRINGFLKFDVDVPGFVKSFNDFEPRQITPEHCRAFLAEVLAATGLDPQHVQNQPVNMNGSSPSLASSLMSNGCMPIGRPASRHDMSSPTQLGNPASFEMKNYIHPNSVNGINNANALLGTSAPAGGLSENGIVYEKLWNIEENMNALNMTGDIENQLSQSLPYQLYPPRSQIKRQKMIYYCKFGEFGVIEGQFTEPSGVAVNVQNDIIVADTNNHRIQVFDKEGRFKFQFGECGKRDGQLLYPNRVSVNRVTGDFIVTERSPTHQIQIFNQYGQFIRKFGANILQHPRGVCVDHQGRIIVVECKVMRVIIFDSYGNVLQKFSCSRYLEFPNGVCATSNNEILISDNRAHCIKVFSYEGQYLRQIGGEGITNYPIGVGINSMGEVVVADNHNNFNLTIFDQKGNMITALESKVKHAQCFDMALVDDGSVVLASKDYRLYLYRYSMPLSMC